MVDERMKNFAFDLSKGPKPNTEIIPPPAMTTFTHPFNYSFVYLLPMDIKTKADSLVVIAITLL